MVLAPYFSYRNDLSVWDGFVFKGERLVITKQMREKMEELLHFSHIGMKVTRKGYIVHVLAWHNRSSETIHLTVRDIR